MTTSYRPRFNSLRHKVEMLKLQQKLATIDAEPYREEDDVFGGSAATVNQADWHYEVCGCCGFTFMAREKNETLCPECAEDAYCEDEQRRDWEERQP